VNDRRTIGPENTLDYPTAARDRSRCMCCTSKLGAGSAVATRWPPSSTRKLEQELLFEKQKTALTKCRSQRSLAKVRLCSRYDARRSGFVEQTTRGELRAGVERI
jgi:hypothetical protein